MKILATGDFHGDTRHAMKMADRAVKENIDLILLCGDIFHGGKHVDGMIAPFARTGKQVLFITGNHDDFSNNDVWEKIYGIKSAKSFSRKKR